MVCNHAIKGRKEDNSMEASQSPYGAKWSATYYDNDGDPFCEDC